MYYVNLLHIHVSKTVVLSLYGMSEEPIYLGEVLVFLHCEIIKRCIQINNI